MPLATILAETDADLVWVADVAPLGVTVRVDERHKHTIACAFTAAADWVELLYETRAGTLCRWGERFTAVAADTVGGGQAGVVVFELHKLVPGLRLRRSGANVTLIAHEVYDDRHVGGAPP